MIQPIKVQDFVIQKFNQKIYANLDEINEYTK